MFDSLVQRIKLEVKYMTLTLSQKIIVVQVKGHDNSLYGLWH